jgi:molecular chaperone GrpE (heat shock protein)
MRDFTELRISKWPFFLGDALFLGAAYFIYFQSKLPMGAWQIFFVVVCVAGGAWLGIMPFLLEYRLTLQLAQSKGIESALGQLQNLEQVAGQIGGATAQWQAIQEQAGKTATVAEAMGRRMAAEAKAFTEFMERANDVEKSNLRLEVEKLHRAENEWLQVLVRVMDHVYALHVGASRSGQPRLVEQVGSFQNACRDTARRIGLTPFLAVPEEKFDPQRHQLAEPETKAPPGAIVAETIATGFTFQGKMIRPALVRLQDKTSATPADKSSVPLNVPKGGESGSKNLIAQQTS